MCVVAKVATAFEFSIDSLVNSTMILVKFAMKNEKLLGSSTKLMSETSLLILVLVLLGHSN